MGEPAVESGLDDRDVERFLAALALLTGLDFRSYARRSVHRRLRHLMLQDGLADLGALGARVLADRRSAAAFAERVCVNVTSMFRDPGFFAALRERVVPLLRELPFFRVWHAGCSSGEEVYSLAILLREEGLHRRARLYATDIDETALARARAGVYPLDVMREYTQQYQRAGGTAAFASYYRASGEGAVLDPALRANVVFASHNLATDASFNEFHVILCRNVLMYFDAALQRRAYDLLSQSLAPGGVLALGQREVVPSERLDGRYAELDAAHKIYRRVA
ncbi:MAG TPA: protein-glutamate O-methyltransferase CheR [Anaeromyxobacteraceae bacterium]